MPDFVDRKCLKLVALALSLAATSPACVFADAPPGAYLQATSKSQKSLAGSAQKNLTVDSSSGASSQSGGSQYGKPLSDSLNENALNSTPGGWNVGSQPYNQSAGQCSSGNNSGATGQSLSDWQTPNSAPPSYQQPSMPYSGYAQQSANAVSPNYPPQQPNFSAPPTGNMIPSGNMGAAPGSDWQADYPSLNEMNAGSQQSQTPQLNANAQVNIAPGSAQSPNAPAKPMIDDATLKTIGAVANTVLPIATTMIMNKMMYGTVAPGMGNYGYGYNPYGGMRNPMGGYGYNRPNMYNNGMIGGGNGGLGGLLNPHY